MRPLFLAVLAVGAGGLPTAAQSNAALATVTEGFGRGQCDALTHQALDSETREWRTIAPSSWDGWVVTRIGPRTLEYVRPGDSPRLMEFEEGTYRDRAPDDSEEPKTWSIVEHGVHGPANWRILMTPPEVDPSALRYSELIMAGNVFIWTNWVDQLDGSRMRTMYFACGFVDK